MMLKFFLIGWICVGLGQNQKCIRVGSEINHPTFEECNSYYKTVREDLSDLEDEIVMNFVCVQAASLEDLTYKRNI